MTLAVLVTLSQLADGLGYQLAAGHGQELNPVPALIGPGILAVKVAAGIVAGFGAYALRAHRQLVAGLAAVGFAGCLTELLALA